MKFWKSKCKRVSAHLLSSEHTPDFVGHFVGHFLSQTDTQTHRHTENKTYRAAVAAKNGMLHSQLIPSSTISSSNWMVENTIND